MTGQQKPYKRFSRSSSQDALDVSPDISRNGTRSPEDVTVGQGASNVAALKVNLMRAAQLLAGKPGKKYPIETVLFENLEVMLKLPSAIAGALPASKCTILLIADEVNVRTRVVVLASNSKTRFFSIGWKKFASEASLRPGDVISMQLIKTDPFTAQVYVCFSCSGPIFTR